MFLEKLINLFKKRVFSDIGSSQLVKEQATYMLFTDLLEELEGKECTQTI